MDKIPERRNEKQEGFELSVAAVDAYESLLSTTKPFIENAAAFPEEIRRSLSGLLILSGDEIEDVKSRTIEAFQMIENDSGRTIPEAEKKEFLERQIGSRMFSKVLDYLALLILFGEFPEGMESANKMGKVQIQFLSQKLLEDVRPILVRDFITKGNEEE